MRTIPEVFGRPRIHNKYQLNRDRASRSERAKMLTYKAAYRTIPEGYFAEALDFPGVVTWGRDLDEARRMLASALADMAETNLILGEPLPIPDPNVGDPAADVEEPIHLLLTAAARVTVAPLAFGAAP